MNKKIVAIVWAMVLVDLALAGGEKRQRDEWVKVKPRHETAWTPNQTVGAGSSATPRPAPAVHATNNPSVVVPTAQTATQVPTPQVVTQVVTVTNYVEVMTPKKSFWNRPSRPYWEISPVVVIGQSQLAPVMVPNKVLTFGWGNQVQYFHSEGTQDTLVSTWSPFGGVQHQTSRFVHSTTSLQVNPVMVPAAQQIYSIPMMGPMMGWNFNGNIGWGGSFGGNPNFQSVW